jgi:hypothetical protein
MNGKGDKPRAVNKSKYDKNYERAFGKKIKFGPLEVDALMIVVKVAELGTGIRTKEEKEAVRVLKNLIKK